MIPSKNCFQLCGGISLKRGKGCPVLSCPASVMASWASKCAQSEAENLTRSDMAKVSGLLGRNLSSHHLHV